MEVLYNSTRSTGNPVKASTAILKGLSDDGAITDVSEMEIAMRNTMMKQADKAYFLCDSSKLGTRYTFEFCKVTDVTGVICDKPLPDFTE